MFGCIYQLWDWLEAPPLFTSATMDAKKLQQLQQANAQKKIPLAYQTNLTDYRTATQSPVFQQQQQAYHHMQFVGGGYQQSPSATSSSGGGPLTPIDLQPQANKLLLKHQLGSAGGTTSNSSHSSPYHQSYSSGDQQLYQSPTERTYLAAAGRLQATSSHNPATALQSQYQQLQQAKMQAQMQTQSEAMQQQHRTFAMRQALNPPIPQGHFHMSQSSSIMSSVTLQSQLHQQQQQQQGPLSVAAQQQHQRAPPSTLNLASQFQPATGPLKVNAQMKTQQQSHFHQQQLQPDQQTYAQQQQQLQLQLQLQHQHQLQPQQQQRLKSEMQTPGSEHSPVYIQQNHPGHVVNQACQTQISAVKPGGGIVTQKNTPSSEDSSAASKSPSHAQLDRKKSSGSIQALKSPITKRPAASPVTLSGWLYKQGSDGLKVWRKRWFVLAEYCLYYYKGPEEEKLLGSILLPSYRVSACSPEDKIYRKFAFKCEHQNMRTYWLAAETAESMIQWVRALTAATMMQAPSSGGESDHLSQPSGSSSLNHSGENSDSGIHTLQSQQSKMSQGQITPASDNGVIVNATGGGSGQPLYANAPPKPRRINDGGYSSPSPEHSIDNERKAQSQFMQQQRQQHQQHQQQQQQSNSSRRSGIMSPTLQQMQQQYQQQHHQQQRSQQPQQHHAIYDTRTGNVSSALRLQQTQQQFSVDNLEAKFQKQMALATDDFPKSPPGSDVHGNYMEMEEQIMRLQQQQQQRPDEIYGERELYMQKLIQQRYPAHLANFSMTERRTPDAYGRSKNRIYSDYEDIYNMSHAAGGLGVSAQEALLQEAASYRRPLSPPTYDGSKHIPPAAMPSRYTPNQLEPTLGQSTSSNLNLRGRSATALVRPHSADFLEYEARAEAAAAAAANPLNASSNVMKTDAMRAPRPKSSLDINRTSDSYYYSEASYAEKMRKSALYLQHPQNQGTAQPQQVSGYRNAGDIPSPVGNGMHTIAGYENPYERTVYNKRNEALNAPLGSQGTSSMPRMSRAGLSSSASSSHIRSASVHPASPTQPTSPSLYMPAMSTAQIIQQNEQFLRSASARLPKRSGAFDDEVTTAASPPAVNTSGSGGGGGTAGAGGGGTHQDGERKREESMKRLLEWKQRMLQSPLTRKGALQAANGGSNMSAMAKLGSNPNILLSSTTVASGTHYGPQTSTTALKSGNSGGNSMVGGVTGIKRSRSETHANTGPTAAGYNSYSSDDEDGCHVKSPAGRLKSNATPTTTSTEMTTTSTQNSTTINKIECNKIKETILTKSNSFKNLQFAQVTNATKPMNNKTFDRIEFDNVSKFLKPILKTSERICRSTNSTPVCGIPSKRLESKPSLRLKLTTNDETESPLATIDCGLENEIAILPKKTAPKSPQNIFYTPVYTTKLLGGSPVKNYENIDIQPKNVTEAGEEEEEPSTTSTLKDNLEEIADKTDDSIVEGDETDTKQPTISEEGTSILKNLQIFKETQKLNLSLEEEKENLSELTDMEEEKINKNVPLNKDKDNDINEDEDDDDDGNNCEYTDDDLDEALAEEADSDVTPLASIENSELQIPTALSVDLPSRNECALIYENELMAARLNAPIAENHYLPMTPKRVDATSAAAAKSYLTLINMNDSNTEEENPYVEMTKNLHSYDESKSNYEEMCLSSSQVGLSYTSSKQQEKLLQIQTEPVYMELSGGNKSNFGTDTKREGQPPPTSSEKSTLKKNNKKNSDTLKKKAKKSSSKRKDLPDILKPSQNTLNLGSDSSDADDESTKHIDAKKMRSRSRFSLSDTFRPASYYLGASLPLTNCAESSDSEIVSPPPIPASPPPIEELKTEEIFSAENYDTVKRRDSSSGKFNTSYEQIPKIHASNTSLNLGKPDAILKSSRLSLPDQFSRVVRHSKTPSHPGHTLLKHHERTLSDSNYSFQTDNSSNTSSDFDLYNKLKKHSPSFVASSARYQSNVSLTSKYNQNILMAPGDSSETDSVEFRKRQGSDSELERQRSRRPLSEESISEIESLNEKFEDAIYTPDLDSYLSQLQTSDCYMYRNQMIHPYDTAVGTGVPSGLITNLIKPPKIFRNKNDEHFYGNMHFASSSDSLQFTGSEARADGSQISNRGTGAASITPTKYLTPMHSRNNSNISEQSVPYYYSELDSSREVLSTPTTLNNQRDVHVLCGANIAHIHNPIDRHQFNMQTLTEKDQAIDSKNLYKMKTNVEKLSYSLTKNLNLKAGETFQTHSHSHQYPQQLPPAESPTFYLQQLKNPAVKLSNFDRNSCKPSPSVLSSTRTSTPTSSTSSATNLPLMAYPQVLHSSSPAPNAQITANIDETKNINIHDNCKNRLENSSGGVGGNITQPLTTGSGGPSNINRELGATPKITTERNAHDTSANKNKFSVLGTVVPSGGGGELLWEEDTLWRESLRRVSQRHARSLDDLDRITAAPKIIAMQKGADLGDVSTTTQRQIKPKISRDVTYVNDNVLRLHNKTRLSASCKSTADYNNETQNIVDTDAFNENDVYVQLLSTDIQDSNSDVYEVLQEEETGSNISHKSTELDRETLRQWDSMSSGLMKNSSCNNNPEANSMNVVETPTSGTVKSIIKQWNTASTYEDGNGNKSNSNLNITQ